MKIVTADFNRDGKPDVVALNSNNVLSILLGRGNSAFAVSKTIATLAANSGTTAARMVAGDFNGDGNQDVLVMLSPGNLVKVFLGHGDGTFAGAVSIAVGLTSAGDLAVGDFNGDDKADIVVANRTSVSVLLGKSSGIFNTPIVTKTSLSSARHLVLALGDVNRDSHLDIAANDTFGGSQVLLGTGSEHFNHDGYLDVAIAATGNILNDNGDTQPYAQVFFGDGKGHFPAAGPALVLSSNFLAAGDFNGDGNADLASLDGSAFEILIGKGDGTFAPPVTYGVGANPVFVLKRDLNGDGKMDVIVVNRDGNDVSVLLGKGDGTFLPQKTFAAGKAPVSVVVGDFNRDGKIDIAVAGSTGVSVLLGNGNGTFQPQITYSATGPLTRLVAASVRQNGIQDLIGINSATQRFVLLPGVGNGTFGAPVVFPLDRVPAQIVAGDFNHDGATDLAFEGNAFDRGDASGRGFTGIGSLAVFYN